MMKSYGVICLVSTVLAVSSGPARADGNNNGRAKSSVAKKKPAPTDDLDDLPLQAVPVTPKKARPVVVPPPPLPPGENLGIVVGLKAGATLAPSGPLKWAFNGALELGYRTPWWHRLLGLSVEPTFTDPSGTLQTAVGEARSKAWVLAVPLLATANVSTHLGLLRALVGPSFDFVKTSTTLVGVSLPRNDTALGFAAGIGYVFYLGPGGLGLEARYHLLPYFFGPQARTANTLGLNATYTFLM